VYNVNKGYNEEMIKRSETLYGYVTFVSTVKEYVSSRKDLADAIRESIKDCIARGILVEYLKKYGSEVQNMLFQEWNWEEARVIWEREAEKREQKKWQAVLADKDTIIADKDAKINAIIADKDAKLADKDAMIAQLLAQQGIIQ